MKRILSVALTLIALLAATALAAVPSPSEDGYVYDGAGVLEEDTEGMIVFSNDLLKAACGAEIAVVTVDSTDREGIDDYSLDLFNKWGIGDSRKQNGFLLLLAIEDDNYYLLPGTGLDVELSGGKLSMIVDRDLEPYFAAKDYDTAVDRTFRSLFSAVAKACDADVTVEQGIARYNEYVASQEQAGTTQSSTRKNTSSGMAQKSTDRKASPVAIILLVLLVVAVIFIVRRVKKAVTAGDNPKPANTPRVDNSIPRPGNTIQIPTIPTIPVSPRTFTAPRRSVWGSGPRPGTGSRPASGSGTRSTVSSGRTFTSRPASSGRVFTGSSRSSGRSISSGRSGGFGGGRSFGGGGSRGGGIGRGR